MTSVAQALVAAFKAHRVRRIYGLPGGGSSLDIIEAARKARIDFILTRHETAAVFMAAAEAELAGTLGVALTTKGPGTANAANGAAHATLDRAPVAVITDGFSDKLEVYVTHQWFDQRAHLAPVTKAHSTLTGADSAGEIDRVIAAAIAPSAGAVHIELTAQAARAAVTGMLAPRAALNAEPASNPTTAALTDARRLLAQAKRPVIVIGLEARAPATTRAIRRLVGALGAPALVTYKAKGVIADRSPHYVGLFTGGAAEQPTVRAADLIITIGLDPVELILQPWPYSVPVLEIARAAYRLRYYEPTVSVYGEIATSVAALTQGAARKAWSRNEIAERRAAMRATLSYRGNGRGLTPQEVVEDADAAVARRTGQPVPRVTVDAGAHMFSATAFWPCDAPNDLLISNGLATMGFALPAAIAAALHDPKRPVIAFTGDGGLLMGLGELETLARLRAHVVVVVFNDAALSLIDIKQQSLALPPRGVRWKRPDFAGVMRSFGARGHNVATRVAYRRALASALRAAGPTLIDVVVDPSGYAEQLRAMRG